MFCSPSPWVPLVGRRVQPGARPQHSSQTFAEDTQQRQRAEHTEEGISRKERSVHRQSLRPRYETAHGHVREPDTQDSGRRRKDLDSRTNRRQR